MNGLRRTADGSAELDSAHHTLEDRQIPTMHSLIARWPPPTISSTSIRSASAPVPLMMYLVGPERNTQPDQDGTLRVAG